MFIASQEGNLDVVRELLARGAVINAAFDNGATPLIQASYNGHTEIVRALLAAGANKRHVQNNGATADSRADPSRHSSARALGHTHTHTHSLSRTQMWGRSTSVKPRG